ncbi:MAG: hypothetical protein EXS16_02630 [Gemmataceae bacterium]|nr:hypothetical protein [Gemmataceae bacterium]
MLWFGNSKPDIVGRWEQVPGLMVYEFRADGSATQTPRGFGGMNLMTQNFTYTQNGSELTLHFFLQIKYEVTRTGNTMHWRPPGAPANFRGIELRKLD